MPPYSNITLYSASVPVFIHYLGQIAHLLEQMDSFANEQQLAESALLDARLADNMFSLGQQLSTAINFSLRACCPLAREDIVSFNAETLSVDSLRLQVQHSIQYLQQLKTEQFIGAEELRITTTAGFAKLELTGLRYLQLYMLPNFFFHYSMCYAILRQLGCPLSKQDFDGFHLYPSDFSF
ncbi:DUF1993 family protein [Agarivorans sp. MS3-6]